MNTVLFSHGLKPWKEAIAFIEKYFNDRGIKVAAVPSAEIENELLADFDLTPEELTDITDKLVMYLMENDFSVQPEITKPEVDPQTIFSLKRKGKILLFPPGSEKEIDRINKMDLPIEAKKPAKHYKLK